MANSRKQIYGTIVASILAGHLKAFEPKIEVPSPKKAHRVVRCFGQNSCAQRSGCPLKSDDCFLGKNSCRAAGHALMGVEECALRQGRDPSGVPLTFAPKDDESPEMREHLFLPTPRLSELAKGGYILFLRHTSRDVTAIRPPEKIEDLDNRLICRPGTMLDETGKKDAFHFGKRLREAGIPIGKVIVSPTCRTKEMAELAFGNSYEVRRELVYALMRKDGEEINLNKKLRQLLSTVPENGKNTILLSHSVVLQCLGLPIPKDQFDMGDIIVIKPEGIAGFKYMGIITKGSWSREPS